MHLHRLLFGLLLIACDPVPVVDGDCREAPRLNRQIAFKANGHTVYEDIYAYRLAAAKEKVDADLAEIRVEVAKGNFSPEQEKAILAKTLQDYQVMLERIPGKLKEETALIELLYQRGLEAGLEITPEIMDELVAQQDEKSAYLEQALADAQADADQYQANREIALEVEMRWAMVEALKTHLMEPEPTQAELDSWYLEKQAELMEPWLDIRQLTVADGELANDLRDQIEAGASFDQLVATHSIDEARDRGGRITEQDSLPMSELRELRRAGGDKNEFSYEKIFENAVDGDVRGPRTEGDGKYVLLYLASTTQRVPSLEEVRETAVQETRKARFEQLVSELRASLQIDDQATRHFPVEAQASEQP